MTERLRELATLMRELAGALVMFAGVAVMFGAMLSMWHGLFWQPVDDAIAFVAGLVFIEVGRCWLLA